MVLAGLDALVPEGEQLLVGHDGELLSADFEVRRRHGVVGVLDDGVVTVAGDADLIGGRHVGALRQRHGRGTIPERAEP